MNRDMILRVADAIEAAAKPETKPSLGFNMNDWVSEELSDLSGHACGTTACIAGWAVSITGREVRHFIGIREAAEDILDLDYDTAENLFVDYPVFSDPTPAQAVMVLRNLAETGEVDWSVALGQAE